MNIIISIDTECDCSPSWNLSNPLSFNGVTRGIKEILQPLFEDNGIKPVYFVSHEVMEDTESRDCLATISSKCELASHLHAGFIQPQKRQGSMAGVHRHEMQLQYEYNIEYEKMKNLTELFEKSFGKKPYSFRAGRYGIGKNTGKILMQLGYKVDSSVTPYIRWVDRDVPDAPDFRDLSEQPYYISETGNIWEKGSSGLLEIPITTRPWKRKLSRFWRKRIIWFRPWYATTKEIIRIINREMEIEQEEQKERVLVMMFHNMEVIPGASPYPQSLDEVNRYLSSLRKAFEYVQHKNIKPVTMNEYKVS